jgi:hypothetical protein
MKKLYCLIFIGLVFLVLTPNSFSKEPVHIDILYMDHGPMQPTLRKLRALFPSYGDKITVAWYDFESDEGTVFKSKMGIKDHIPMAIWVDSQSELMDSGRKIKFQGFPSGSGPAFFQGKWKVENLANILDQLTGIEN